MKKKLVSALALMMSCVMLAACGGNKVEENTATPQTETSEAATESTEEAASTETEAAGELTDVNVAALKGPTAMGMVKLMAVFSSTLFPPHAASITQDIIRASADTSFFFII